MPMDQGIDLQNLQEYASQTFGALSQQADTQKDADLEAGKNALGKVTMKADGTVTVEGHKDYFQDIIKKAQEGVQLKSQVSQIEQMLQGELQKVQTRENAYNRSPILGALANIAGNLAQQKNMPGVVQALGRSSVELNPTPQMLTGQKLNILGALEQAQRNQREEERAQFGQNLALAEFGERAAKAQQDAENKIRDAREKFESKWDDRAQKGFFDPARMAAEAARTGVYRTPEEIQSLVASTADTARTYERMRKMGLEADVTAAGQKAKATEEAKLPFVQKEKQYEQQLIEGREKRVAQFRADIAKTGAAVKLSSNERMAVGDIMMVKDLAKDLKGLVEPMAKQEESGFLGQAGAKMKSLAKAGAYSSGMNVNDAVDNKIVQLSSLIKIVGSKPYMKGIRNMQYISQIQEHLPKPTDTMQTKLQRLNDILPIYDMMLSDMKHDAQSSGPAPLADDFVKYLRSLPPGQMAKNTDGSWWRTGNDGNPTQVTIQQK